VRRQRTPAPHRAAASDLQAAAGMLALATTLATARNRPKQGKSAR